MKDILIYTLAISIVIIFCGCGEDVEDELSLMVKVIPPEGSEIEFNSEITIELYHPVKKVTVNGSDAVMIAFNPIGTIWKWKDGCFSSGPITLRIEWENEDGSVSVKSISYFVKPYEYEPVMIVSSRPKDGEKNVDSAKLDADGMEIQFSKSVRKVNVDVIADGEKLPYWSVQLSDDKTKVFLVLLKGPDMPYESVFVLEIVVEDLVGCKEEFEITFTTKAMEEN